MIQIIIICEVSKGGNQFQCAVTPFSWHVLSECICICKNISYRIYKAFAWWYRDKYFHDGHLWELTKAILFENDKSSTLKLHHESNLILQYRDLMVLHDYSVEWLRRITFTISTANNPTNIWTRYIPNTNLKHHHYTILLTVFWNLVSVVVMMTTMMTTLLLMVLLLSLLLLPPCHSTGLHPLMQGSTNFSKIRSNFKIVGTTRVTSNKVPYWRHTDIKW